MVANFWVTPTKNLISSSSWGLPDWSFGIVVLVLTFSMACFGMYKAGIICWTNWTFQNDWANKFMFSLLGSMLNASFLSSIYGIVLEWPILRRFSETFGCRDEASFEWSVITLPIWSQFNKMWQFGINYSSELYFDGFLSRRIRQVILGSMRPLILFVINVNNIHMNCRWSETLWFSYYISVMTFGSLFMGS